MPRSRTNALAALIAILAVAGISGCGGAEATEPPGLRIMVPNASGSGYDMTARNVARVLQDAEIAPGVEVFNLPGTGGIVGLQRLAYEEGNNRLLMVMGLGLIGAQAEHQPRARLEDMTPIARLLEEPNVVVVSHDSPYRTLGSLLADWRADPGSLTVGGGSRPGGPDHQAPMLVAREIGIDPSDVEYQQYDGGGRLLPAIVRGEVDFAITGLAENAQQYESGQLRVLALTGEQPVDGIGAPTLREAGVDVVFANWRGIVGPPGLSPAEVSVLRDTVAELRHSDQWRQVLDANGWIDAYLPGEDFGEFIEQQVALLDDLMINLGFTSRTG